MKRRIFKQRTFHRRFSMAIAARGLSLGSIVKSSAPASSPNSDADAASAPLPPIVDSPSEAAPGESLSLPNPSAHRRNGVADATAPARPPMAVEGRPRPSLVAGRRRAPAKSHVTCHCATRGKSTRAIQFDCELLGRQLTLKCSWALRERVQNNEARTTESGTGHCGSGAGREGYLRKGRHGPQVGRIDGGKSRR